jgi:hypothetical protein
MNKSNEVTERITQIIDNEVISLFELGVNEVSKKYRQENINIQ